MKRWRVWLACALCAGALLGTAGCASAPAKSEDKAQFHPRPLAVYDIDTDTATEKGLAYPEVTGEADGAAAVLAQ